MSLKTAFTHHRRSRSNITPGDLPPIETRQSSCDTTTTTSSTSPNSSRRNSDGSPRVPVALVNASTPSPPPDINIFAPSPSAIANTDYSSHHPMPTETTTTTVEEKYPSSRSASPIPHVSDPQPTLSSTSAVSRLFAKKPRSRGSSLSNHFHNSDSVPAPTTSVSDIHLPIMNHSNTSATRLRPSSPSPPPPSSSAAPTPSSVNDRVVAAPGTIASVCGVELANAKRNQDFHALFRSVPEEDPLIEGNLLILTKQKFPF